MWTDKSIFKKIGRNFINVGIYQLSNFLFYLIITPFLVSRVGLEKFGVISTGMSVASILTVICDYGFIFTATRDISINKDSDAKVGFILSNILSFKLILLFLAFIVQLLLLPFAHFFEYALFYFLSFALVLGKAFFPSWYFQGVEKMHFLSIYSITGKIISFGLLYIMVFSSSDFLYVNLITGSVDFIISLLALYIIYRRRPFRLIILTISQLRQAFKKGGHFFLSSLFIVGYSGINPILLSFFMPSTTIGSYAVAEKIIFIFKTMPYLVFQAIYPYACALEKDSLIKLRLFVKQVFYFLVISFTLVSLFVFVFSERIVMIFSKENVLQISSLLRVLSAIPLFVAINNPAYLILIATNRQKYYFKLVIITTILNLLCNICLIPYFHLYASAFSLALSEFFIAISLHVIIIIKFNDINFLRRPLFAEDQFSEAQKIKKWT